MTQGEHICLRCGRAGHVSASCPQPLPQAGIIVGIDPGVHTGLAIWASSEQRLVEVKSCGIVEAMSQLEACRAAIALIVMEDARLRTWFGTSGREVLLGAGSVRRDCSIWTEWAERHSIPLRGISPQQKGAKLNADVFARITGWKGKTNEHARDAGVLAFLGAKSNTRKAAHV